MTFRVVTYNILADAYISTNRYDHVPPKALEASHRHPLLMETIRTFDADVYCLQEVEPHIFEKLQTTLGEDYSSIYEQKPNRPDGCAVFYKNNVFTCLDSKVLHYKSHSSRDNQLALIAHLSDGEQTYAVVSTHLRWQPPRTNRRDHVGRLQLLELLNRREELAPEGAHWLIAGDFNAISESVVLQAALERHFELSCRTQRPWDTCNINGRRRKLDYILYSSKQLHAQPGRLPSLERDTPMPSLTTPSDHFPVSVDFTPLR